MWKRLNNPRGVRQPVEEPRKMYDGEGNNYNNYLGLAGQDRRAGGGDPYGYQSRAPERPRRPDAMPPTKGLPRLPFEVNPPNSNQDSTFRPASSIYSQPSPNPIHTRFHHNQYQTTYDDEVEVEDVSPESSPELLPFYHRSQSQDHEGVSPIDEMPDVSHYTLGRQESSTNNPSSNIPVLRREKRNQVAAAAANLVNRKKPGDVPRGRIAHDPRWDPYSGEITTSDKGKPQSVKPGTFTVPGLRPVHKETGLALGNESNITAGSKQHTSFSDRVRRLKSTTGNPPAERPGWKGATGRVTLVAPVQDQLDMPPISLPRKSSKHIASPDSETFSSGGSGGGGGSPVTVIGRNGSGETSPASANHPSPSIRAVMDNDTGNQDTSSKSSIDIKPDQLEVSQSNAAGTLARNAKDGTSPNSPRGPTQEKWERDEGTMANIERNFVEQLRSVSSPIEEEPEPEYSSVTTYAPSTANNKPRPSTDTSNPRSMPTPPNSHPPPPPADSLSLLNRQRPRLSDSPKTNSIVSRKAVPPLSSPVFISMSSVPSNLPSSQRSSNIAKNLPLSPAEASSLDLVTSLEAQLENLAHRRINIVRSIRQMTELMPKDSVMDNVEVRRKREMEKRKVESLRIEEADVRREEHEIGLKLHRALKRRDKDAIYEPTGLWVRRING